MQVPLKHIWLSLQLFVHVPQFALSLFTSTQVPPQSTVPEAQLAVLALQTPLSHVCPVAQALSQLPQCAGAADSSTH